MSSEYTLDWFVSLERKVWDGLVAGDPTVDADMLADDFLGVYSTGFDDKSGHISQLRYGPTIQSYRIMEPRYIELAEGLVLLAYRAEFQRSRANDSAAHESMYVSSIWRLRRHHWRNIFSQDTNCEVSA